jgi:hypothetical protein
MQCRPTDNPIRRQWVSWEYNTIQYNTVQYSIGRREGPVVPLSWEKRGVEKTDQEGPGKLFLRRKGVMRISSTLPSLLSFDWRGLRLLPVRERKAAAVAVAPSQVNITSLESLSLSKLDHSFL